MGIEDKVKNQKSKKIYQKTNHEMAKTHRHGPISRMEGVKSFIGE